MIRVYLITNKVNGKLYVGQTETDLETRWKMHCSYNPNKLLFEDIIKYGKGAFTIETLCLCPSQAAADITERFFIKYLGTRKRSFGYNILEGGSSRGYFGQAEALAADMVEMYLRTMTKEQFRYWRDVSLFRLPDEERLTYEKVLKRYKKL